MAGEISAPQEIELKLQLPPSGAEQLLHHPLLAQAGIGAETRARIRTVYFDTPELALHRRGLALRLRDTPDRKIQTVKSKGRAEAGLYRRAEDECAIDGAVPELDAIGDPALREIIHAETRAVGREVHPTVETETTRVTRRLRVDDTELELALDVGEVRTHVGSRPIRELELELVRGDAAVLFDVADALHAVVPLTLSAASKADIGFQMLLETAPVATRARPLKLGAGSSLDEALAAIFAECTRQIVDNLPVASEGTDPEGVHQLRVGTRRLRSALSLLRAQLPEPLASELRTELRWLASDLGPARELDVFLTETLAPILEVRPGDPSLKRLQEAAEAARATAYVRVRAALTSPRTTRLLLRLGRTLAGHDWRKQPLSADSARLFSPARERGAELLTRFHRKARKHGKHLPSRPVEVLHELRIDLKKLRYLGEFFAATFPGADSRPFLRRAARLQNTLGTLNDGTEAQRVLEGLLEDLGEERRPEYDAAAGFVLGWIQRGTRDELAKAAKRSKRFLKAHRFWGAEPGRNA